MGLTNIFGSFSNTVLIRTGQARQCSTCKHHHHPQWLAATQVYFFVHTKYRFGLAVGQLHMTIALTPRPRVTEQARSGASPVTVTGKIQSVAKVAIEVSIHLEGAQHTVHVSLAKVGHMAKSRRTRVCPSVSHPESESGHVSEQ